VIFYNFSSVVTSTKGKLVNYIAHYRKYDNHEQTVDEHLQSVAQKSKIFASAISLPLCGEIVGLLHDLGKYSNEFQQYIRSGIGLVDPDAEEYVDAKEKKGKIDHSTAGGQYIYNVENDDKVFLYLNQLLSLTIVSHHGGLMDCLAPDGTDKYSQRMAKDNKKTHYDEVIENASTDVIEMVRELICSDQILYELMTVLKKIPKQSQNIYLSLLARFLLSCLLDADRIDSADFEIPENKAIRLNTQYPGWDKFINALEVRLSNFSIENRVDEVRQEVSEVCKQAGGRELGIYTLTVPTGGGKTLASLRFALEHAAKHKLDRIVYVIPYTSIIDQNAREVQNVFASLSEEYGVELVLEHHSNLTPEKETTAQRLMCENWDAPIVFTTSVQLLDALFKGGTRSARRMHHLANAVIVFDEVQTIPIKTVHLFNNAMNFLTNVCGSSVVLCTATQPLLHDVDKAKGAIKLSPYSEIMPDVPALFEELRRVEVIDRRKIGGYSDEQIAELIKEELSVTGSVLTIVNTKKSAENLFYLCKDIAAEVYHLSTNQCPQHRLEVIDQIREKACPFSTVPVICISTQLIEAGVDIDFGTVIRFVAGLDSLAQAAGRCNRSGKRKKNGRVLLLNPFHENIARLPEIKIGKEKCERVLSEYDENCSQFDDSLVSPKALSRYFKYYFYDRSSDMDFPVSSNVALQGDTLLEMLSKNSKAVDVYKRANGKFPLLPFCQSFATAGKLFNVIDSQTQGVIVPYGNGKKIIADLCASADITRENDLLRQAQRFSVNCYEQTFRSLAQVGALHNIGGSGVYCLYEQHYSKDLGVSVAPINKEIDIAYCGV
jgi:CRISPR-associated endonuclease/helicase Cas3